MDFIIVNGDIVKKNEPGFFQFFQNDNFIITDKLWFGYGGIPLFHEHSENLKLMLDSLSLPFPDLLNDEREMFRIIKRMLNKNKFYRSGLITFMIYANQVESNFTVSCNAFPETSFPISKQGLILNFSEFQKFNANPLNRFAFFNIPSWKFAEGRNFNTTFNNSIFLNENDNVCDCISANIFMIKGKTIYTPSVKTGCYTDHLRNHILEVALKSNLKVIESEDLKKEDVLQMSEIFLASEENGIQWVLGVENKRFVHNISIRINEILNEHLKNLVL